MDDAPQLGAVVARPMQDRIDVHHAVAGLEPDLHTARQRCAGVVQELLVLPRRVQTPMTAGTIHSTSSSYSGMFHCTEPGPLASMSACKPAKGALFVGP